MQFSFHFIGANEVISPETIYADAIYIGLGDISHPQVFDHHNANSSSDATPASLVWARRDEIIKLWSNTKNIDVYLSTYPAWNSCWAVTLLGWLLDRKALEDNKIIALNRFTAYSSSGYNPCDGSVEKSVLAIFENRMREADEDNPDDPIARDYQRLKDGSHFFDFCYQAIHNYDDLKGGDFISADGPFGLDQIKIREDHQTYLRDLQRGHRFIAQVSHRSGDIQKVDGLSLTKPVSRLFKFWARSDNEHSAGKAGFPLTWIQWEDNRWIISVDPASGFLFKELGNTLTAAEGKITPPDTSLPVRPGYDVPNPWYDARNTEYAYTYLDVPRGGTGLDAKQMEKILRRYFKVKAWRPAITVPNWWRDKFAPYAIPVAASILVSLAAWQFQPVKDIVRGCSDWANLPKLEIYDGKHYAIVIGINNYSHAKKGWNNLNTPVSDAKAVMHQLHDNYGFEPITTHLNQTGSFLLTTENNQTMDEDTIKSHIRTLAAKMTPADSLLIYYAGHGFMDETFGYWVPSNGGDEAKNVEHSWLRQVMKSSPARHIIVISDSCYSGKFFDNGNKGSGKVSDHGSKKPVMRGLDIIQQAHVNSNLNAAYQQRSRSIFTSGFLETVPDGDKRSPFSECLTNSLQSNTNKYLTMFDLVGQMKHCLTQTKYSEAKRPRFGRIDEACDMDGDFVLRKQ